MDLTITDVSLAQDQSGEPRVNLGDVTTGKGFASGVPCWGSSDGFVSIPNGPDGGPSAPQALMATEGNIRYALAVRDPRFVGQVGQLAEGDRAVVSACDAGLRVTKADNKIQMLAVAQGMEVTLDAAGQSIKAALNGASIYLDATTVELALGPLRLILTGDTVSIATISGPPAVLRLNGVPVT